MVVTLILALVLSLGAVAWVVWPLLSRKPAPVLVEDDRLTDLLSRKDAVMTAIRDLDFDHKVGKIDEEDFQRYDARLRRQAVGLLQQIEQVAPASTGLDATVEQEVMRRRRVSDTPVAVPALTRAPAAARQVSAPAVPTAIVAPGAAPTVASNGTAARQYCTNCGAALDVHHRFCGECGTPVAQRASELVSAE